MNREITGGAAASIYPLVGDVTSTPGSQKVVVSGIQTIAISPTFPADGQVLAYDFNSNTWIPKTLTLPQSPFHDEPLTDGNGNFIFAASLSNGGDIIVVTGVN